MKTRREWFSQVGIVLGTMMLSTCSVPTSASQSPPGPGVVAWNRAAFGPRPGDLENFDLERFVEQQLHPESLDDSECERRLRSAGFETLGKSLHQLWSDHWLPYQEAESDEDIEWAELPFYETVQATFLRAVYSRRQLREVMADFWHNHFNVYGLHEDVICIFSAYDRDAIRPHLLGNFRRLLEAVASHPAMLMYLDNRSNEVSGPNENFARELLELHTLGQGNYSGSRLPTGVARDSRGLARSFVDNDVYEVARCFTGWTLDEDVTGQFRYESSWHDRFNKLVLGRYLRSDSADLADGRAVLDLLAEHPGTARHVAFKLCRRLVADEPPPALVEKAAGCFLDHRSAPDQIARTVGVILRSPEFRTTWGAKAKRPFEFTVSLLRALEVDCDWLSDEFLEAFDRMGQPLFSRLTPDGYPDVASTWQHTSSLLYRWRMVQGLLSGEYGLKARLGERTDYSARLLGRPSRHAEDLQNIKSPRELVALLAMGPEFQQR